MTSKKIVRSKTYQKSLVKLVQVCCRSKMKPDYLMSESCLSAVCHDSTSTPLAPTNDNSPGKVFSGVEIASAARAGSRWIIIDGEVFDVAPLFAPGAHPGGVDVLTSVVGGDATDPFYNSHPSRGRKAMLVPYRIGVQSDWSVTPSTAAYRALRAELEASGVLSSGGSLPYYGASTARVTAFAAIALGCILGGSSSAIQILGAAMLGIFWQQLAFVGHDLGHNGVSGLRSTDTIRGIICGPMLTGISFSWWKATHNAHHVATNSATCDPDVQHMPLLALSSHFFQSLWSTFHHKRMGFGGCARATVARQHIFFYPLMFFARWNLYFQGVARLALGEATWMMALEALALTIFFTWNGLLVAAVGRAEETLLAAWAVRGAYLLISNGVAGILHIQISVSHFSQPTIKTRACDENVSFLEAQLAGTLNITLPSAADFIFGGLQFQVEHHLFPRLPSEKLRALMPHIKALAAAHSLPYNETSFFEANAKLYRSLRDIAKSALVHGTESFDPTVIDALNMQG